MQLDTVQLTDIDLLRHLREVVEDTGIKGLTYQVSSGSYKPFYFTDGSNFAFGQTTADALELLLDQRTKSLASRVQETEERLAALKAQLKAQQEAEL